MCFSATAGHVAGTTSNVQSQGTDFCEGSNFTTSIMYINQALQQRALPQLPSSVTQHPATDAMQIVNIVYYLLQQQQKQAEQRETLLDKQRRWEVDKQNMVLNQVQLTHRHTRAMYTLCHGHAQPTTTDQHSPISRTHHRGDCKRRTRA